MTIELNCLNMVNKRAHNFIFIMCDNDVRILKKYHAHVHWFYISLLIKHAIYFSETPTQWRDNSSPHSAERWCRLQTSDSGCVRRQC